MIVLIDDLRTFKPSVISREGYTLLTTPAEALEWFKSLEKGTRIDQLWFDHDLGEIDGVIIDVMPVVNYLENLLIFDKGPDIREVVVHTSNNNGGDKIMSAMRGRVRTVRRVDAGIYLEHLDKD